MCQVNGPRKAILPPRVGINAVFLRPKMGGLETYVNALMPELIRQQPQLRVSVFCGPEGKEQLRAQAWASQVSLVTHPLLGRPGLKAVSELTVLGRLASERVDLLHNVAMTGPLRTRAANVVMIHDLTWLIAPDPADRITNAVWRIAVPPVARRADRVIALSEAAAADIARYLRVPTTLVDVVPHGPGIDTAVAATDEGELRQRFGLGEGQIVLTVSAKRRHKNLARLVEAMALVTHDHPNAVLVMPGNPTPHEAELKQFAHQHGLGANVAFLEYVEAADLEGLYRAATCVAFPSINEGFGLPVLEAMRRGVPVACARASSLPEVAGDAAEYFDPFSTEDIARTLTSLLGNPQRARELADAGRRQAERFSWTATAEATLDSWARAWSSRR